jgi:predicted transcriptional regulator
MEVHLHPDVQSKLDRLSMDTGRAAVDLIEDALAGYFDELSDIRETLDRRYDDLRSGRVRPVSGEEVKARLRERSARHRSGRNDRV